MHEFVSVNHPVSGLILSGGGARAAYQVGVLAFIAEHLSDTTYNPFPVIVGSSAGALNAVRLACGAQNFSDAVRGLTRVWQNFRTDQVYRSDWAGVLRHASRFVGHGLFGLSGREPTSLLDSSPLRELLAQELDFKGIHAAIAQGCLHAVAVTAMGYTSGQAATFYQGCSRIEPWFRHRRQSVPTPLSLEHLMASAAIPLIFPAVKIHHEYFGDGAVRQASPISTALHLGATRVLVIGGSGDQSGGETQWSMEVSKSSGPPGFAQISGHLLNSTFIDNLQAEMAWIERLNHVNRHIAPDWHPASSVRGQVEVLVISPSQPLERIAARHRHELPRTLRILLRSSGPTSASALSSLLFESGYCSELIELGYEDAMVQKEAILRHLGQDTTGSTGPRARETRSGITA